jgi:hypothetical protein
MSDGGQYLFPNLLAASSGLLLDVCERLTELRTNYVIVGGRVPYLRVKHDILNHPGTKDVDVLLNDDKTLLRKAVTALLQAGYLLSAKHPFQLLRTLNVKNDNEHQTFVFNVDLMHPSEESAQIDMFADILEMNVADNYDPGKHAVKSIAFPSSSIVFAEKLWSDVCLSGVYPDGRHGAENIPLLDEAASVLSKSESATKKKRERDAYDIYYILTGEHGGAVADKLRSLSARFPQVNRQLGKLEKFLATNDGERFRNNVMRFVPHDQLLDRSLADEVRQ